MEHTNCQKVQRARPLQIGILVWWATIGPGNTLVICHVHCTHTYARTHIAQVRCIKQKGTKDREARTLCSRERTGGAMKVKALKWNAYHHSPISRFFLFFFFRLYSSRILSFSVYCIRNHNRVKPYLNGTHICYVAFIASRLNKLETKLEYILEIKFSVHVWAVSFMRLYAGKGYVYVRKCCASSFGQKVELNFNISNVYAYMIGATDGANRKKWVPGRLTEQMPCYNSNDDPITFVCSEI